MRIDKLIKTKYKINIKGIKTNYTDIKNGDLFVCALDKIDKKDYIKDAIGNGCSFVIANSKVEEDIPYKVCEDVDVILKKVLDIYYHHPLKKINLIGVMGIDEKTSITTILKDMTNSCCIGSNGFISNKKVIDLHNKTSSLDRVYEYVDKAIKKNKKNVFMEVSSESYLTNRIPNLFFDIGVLRDITKESLDKHKTFNNYFDCQMKFLKNCGLVVVNRDSPYFNKIKNINCNYVTYGFKKSDITILKYRLYIDYTYIKFNYHNKDYNVVSPLIGKNNIYNLMACILVMLNLNYQMDDILKKVNLIKKIKGRNEIVYKDDFMVMIDQVYTINAMKSVLKYVKQFVENRLIVVIGCTNEKYEEKRKKIGHNVLKYADVPIFTTDDFRRNDSNRVIDDMLKGHNNLCKKYYRIIDRKLAIKKAIRIAEKGDFILVLRIISENELCLGNRVISNSDYQEIKKNLREYF